MFDHKLIETLEGMQGQPIFLAVWQNLYDEVETAYCRGEFGVSQYNYAHRLLAKVR